MFNTTYYNTTTRLLSASSSHPGLKPGAIHDQHPSGMHQRGTGGGHLLARIRSRQTDRMTIRRKRRLIGRNTGGGPEVRQLWITPDFSPGEMGKTRNSLGETSCK